MRLGIGSRRRPESAAVARPAVERMVGIRVRINRANGYAAFMLHHFDGHLLRIVGAALHRDHLDLVTFGRLRPNIAVDVVDLDYLAARHPTVPARFFLHQGSPHGLDDWPT